MGKKKSKKKKGDGAKKTAEKTAKAEAKALKKELGEDDIDQLLADLRVKDAQQSVVTVTPCEPPTPRSGATWHAHPRKEELVMFGGELYDGRITSVYNDLFIYSIPKREWRRVSSPNCPPPRSAHQAVVRDSQESPELWLFGGEFTSPSGSQFHHYRDLWKLDLNSYAWTCYSGFAAEKSDSKKEKKAAAGASSMSSALSTSGPSARSGHRMIICKSRIFIFGGFFSRGDTTKYFDDLWCWDLETMAWMPGPIQPASALHPAARSGFGFVCNEREETAYIFGGFALEAKQKKEDPKAGAGAGGKGGKSAAAKSSSSQQVAVAHSDLWSLNLVNFSYSPLKKRGYFPASGRFAFGVTTQKEKARAFVFGGLKDSEQDQQQQQQKGGGGRKRAGDSDDDEDDEDDLSDSLATTYNDLYCFDLRKPTEGGPGQKFFFVDYKGEAKNKVASYEVSVKKKAAPAAGAAAAPAAAAVEKKEGEEPEEESSVFDFNPVVEGSASSSSSSSTAAAAAPSASDAAPSLSPSAPAPVPAPRRSAHLCVKNNLLFLYGGVREEGSNDVEHTFGDLWCIDINRGAGQAWEQLMGGAAVEWAGSDAEPDEAEEEEEEEEKESERKKKAAAKKKQREEEEEEEEDEEESSSDESDDEDKPAAASSSSSSSSSAPAAALKPTLGESLTVYFARTKAHWMSAAVGALEADRVAEEARVIAEAAEAKRVADQEAKERAQQEAELLARAGIDAAAETATAAEAAAGPDASASAASSPVSASSTPAPAAAASAPSKKDSKDREKESKKDSKKESKDSKKDKKAAKEESSSSSSGSSKSAKSSSSSSSSAAAAPSNDSAAYEKALRTKAFELASARFQQR